MVAGRHGRGQLAARFARAGPLAPIYSICANAATACGSRCRLRIAFPVRSCGWPQPLRSTCGERGWQCSQAGAGSRRLDGVGHAVLFPPPPLSHHSPRQRTLEPAARVSGEKGRQQHELRMCHLGSRRLLRPTCHLPTHPASALPAAAPGALPPARPRLVSSQACLQLDWVALHKGQVFHGLAAVHGAAHRRLLARAAGRGRGWVGDSSGWLPACACRSRPTLASALSLNRRLRWERPVLLPGPAAPTSAPRACAPPARRGPCGPPPSSQP